MCPHSGIRTKFYVQDRLRGPAESFLSVALSAVGLPDTHYTLQVCAADCTGCGLCVEACPVIAPGTPLTKAINLGPREPIVEASRDNIAFFETLPFTSGAAWTSAPCAELSSSSRCSNSLAHARDTARHPI